MPIGGQPSDSIVCDVLIVGGGTGACAAAYALAKSNLKVVMTEPTTWIGGQLTSQAVPPDEHPWIESFGCTASYRRFRNAIREAYRSLYRLTQEAQSVPHLNPGQGWVSRLCHEPKIALYVLNSMLHAPQTSGRLTVLTETWPVSAKMAGPTVTHVTVENAEGKTTEIKAKYFLDASELGDLLPLTETPYRLGSESTAESGESHATQHPERDNVQGITWCFAMGYDSQKDHRIPMPSTYARWSSYAPDFWVGPLLSWNTLHAHTMEPHTWTLFGSESPTRMGLFDYRQIVSPTVIDEPGLEPVTIVNWPQNDYFLGSILDEASDVVADRLEDSRQLSSCLLFWLQHEAPRPDGGQGWPGLRMRGDITGTRDGFAMAPYIRESRRLEAEFTVLEQHVSAHDRPGEVLGEKFADSVGIGAYRIDLHPSTNGANTVDFSSLPFQIPLGSLISIEKRNLIAAAKNIGVTHITNGCYRLHPVEWNIGEAAGHLAAYCLENHVEPSEVRNSDVHLARFQRLLRHNGFELEWPELRAL